MLPLQQRLPSQVKTQQSKPATCPKVTTMKPHKHQYHDWYFAERKLRHRDLFQFTHSFSKPMAEPDFNGFSVMSLKISQHTFLISAGKYKSVEEVLQNVSEDNFLITKKK